MGIGHDRVNLQGTRLLVFLIQWHLYPSLSRSPCCLLWAALIIILAFKQNRPEFYWLQVNSAFECGRPHCSRFLYVCCSKMTNVAMLASPPSSPHFYLGALLGNIGHFLSQWVCVGRMFSSDNMQKCYLGSCFLHQLQGEPSVLFYSLTLNNDKQQRLLRKETQRALKNITPIRWCLIQNT